MSPRELSLILGSVAGLADVVGGALVAEIVCDLSMSAESRGSKFAEAEGLLLESGEQLRQNSSLDWRLRHDPLERLVRLYEAWDTFSPNTGKSAQAELWKGRLEALEATRSGAKP